MDSTTKSLVSHAQNTHTHAHTPARATPLSRFTNVPYTLYNLGGYWPPPPTRIALNNTATRASECVTQERRNEGRLSPTFPTKKGKGESVLRGLGSISPALLRIANANELA